MYQCNVLDQYIATRYKLRQTYRRRWRFLHPHWLPELSLWSRSRNRTRMLNLKRQDIRIWLSLILVALLIRL